MHRLAKIYVLISFFSLTLVDQAVSQITQSPYSMFGLGTIEENCVGASRGMGGTGIAFLSGTTLNILNPASYSGIDSLVSIFELGFSGNYTSFDTNEDYKSMFNGNLKYFTMGFRTSPRLATSFGFVPYSTIGYNINSLSGIENSYAEYYETFSGEGGVNKFYLGNSYKLTKNLSLGINAVFLLGNVTHSESSSIFAYKLEDKTYVSNFNLNYGLNYRFEINKWKYNVGLIYDNGKRLRTENVTTIKTANESEVLRKNIRRYSLPRAFGVGLAVQKDGFRGGLDYETKEWSSIEFNNDYLKTRNSNRYSMGLEYSAFNGNNKYISYRLGVEYNESYMVIHKIPINYKSVTVGTGLPLRGYPSVINVSFEYGQNGSKKEDLIKETFYTLHLDISFKDFWFIKRKYN
ncbi:MAG TPA: hypothetical protein PLR88_04795 [Bacteroidales bacterium]|nr:hypothetical protein [Bacteroidales bacterium]